jgi:hypothetical protein
MTRLQLTYPKRGKENRKVGLIPVSTTTADTCPDACPFKAGGCYAQGGPLAIVWRRVADTGLAWQAFLNAVRNIPSHNETRGLWRHNQAGDLPGQGDTLDCGALGELVAANAAAGARGFTYTHKPLRLARERKAVAAANAAGFTVNLSGNTLRHADTLAELGVGPVVTVLSAEVSGNADIRTPAGRRVVVCPATYRENVSCATCQLCQVADRKVIVGFPAHGASKRKASNVAMGI